MKNLKRSHIYTTFGWLLFYIEIDSSKLDLSGKMPIESQVDHWNGMPSANIVEDIQPIPGGIDVNRVSGVDRSSDCL